MLEIENSGSSIFFFLKSFVSFTIIVCVCLQCVSVLVLKHAHRRAQTAANVCVGVGSLHLGIWGTELSWSDLCRLFHYRVSLLVLLHFSVGGYCLLLEVDV